MRAWRFSDIKIPCVRQVLVGEPIDHSLVSDMVRGYMHIHTHIYIQPRRLEKKTQKGAINHPEFSFHFPTVCRVGIARIKAQSPLLTMPYLYRNIPIPNKNLCACVRCKIEEYFITMLEYGGKNSIDESGYTDVPNAYLVLSLVNFYPLSVSVHHQ